MYVDSVEANEQPAVLDVLHGAQRVFCETAQCRLDLRLSLIRFPASSQLLARGFDSTPWCASSAPSPPT